MLNFRNYTPKKAQYNFQEIAPEGSISITGGSFGGDSFFICALCFLLFCSCSKFLLFRIIDLSLSTFFKSFSIFFSFFLSSYFTL